MRCIRMVIVTMILPLIQARFRLWRVLKEAAQDGNPFDKTLTKVNEAFECEVDD